MHQIQIIRDKKTWKVEGWATGIGLVTRVDCETEVINFNDDDYKKITSGKYELKDVDDKIVIEELQSVIDDGIIKSERAELKEKFKNKTATSDEISRALELLL